jgi:hypothetical protein
LDAEAKRAFQRWKIDSVIRLHATFKHCSAGMPLLKQDYEEFAIFKLA